MHRFQAISVSLLLFTLIFSGCSASYSVHGIVVNGDGTPLEGATFILAPHKHDFREQAYSKDISKEDGTFAIGWCCVPGIELFKLKTECEGYKDDVRYVKSRERALRIVLEKRTN